MPNVQNRRMTRDSPRLRVATRAAGTTLFASLGVLVAAAALVVAARLQIPGLGADATPLEIFEVVVLTALGSLGAPVSFGEAQMTAMPLGSLALVGLAMWRAARNEEALDPRLEMVALVGVGPAVAVVAALGAVLADASTGGTAVRVEPEAAAAAGLAWGSVAGSVATAARLGPRAGVTSRIPVGFRGGGAMVTAALLLGGAGALVAFATAYVRGVGVSLPAALGASLHAVFFLPNLAASVLTLGLGADIAVGAGLVADTRTYSLVDWNGDRAPIYAYLSLVAPLAAAAWGVRKAPEVVGLRRLAAASLGFGLVAWAAAMLAPARLGFDVSGDTAVLAVVPDAGGTFLLGLVWPAVTFSLAHLARRGPR